VARYPRARGAAAVAAKAQLALRSAAERAARRALEREAELAQQPPDARTVAVLPAVVAGDSTYRPLSRGLAELLTTDLAYIRDLRLVERLQIGALLDELQLAASERVDPATALAASVVGETGVVRPVGEARGPFRRLLDLEKQVVFDLADQFGIALTEAERDRIRRRGPTSVLALLAYGRGLEALDRGDYGAAARHFAAALRAEPGFAAARAARDAAIAAPVAAAIPGDRPEAAVAAVERALAAAEPAGGAANALLAAAGLDIVPALGDAVAAVGGATSGTSVLGRDLTAEALVAAAPLAAQERATDAGTAARSGAVFDAYAFGAGFAFRHVVEWTVPVALSQRVGSRLVLDLATAYARASAATATSGTLEISGLTDTDLRATWAAVPGHLVLVLAAALPTGRREVPASAVPLLSALATDLLGFTTSSFGSGGGAAGGFATAIGLGTRWAGGVAASYRWHASYTPVAGSGTLEPGGEARVRVGVEGPVWRGGYLRGAVTYDA